MEAIRALSNRSFRTMYRHIAVEIQQEIKGRRDRAWPDRIDAEAGVSSR
jgi:hypothetical protein